jgi:hypothetical protein
MAKPTTPFGFIAFGKDGSIKSHLEKLPCNKRGQETAIAGKLLALSSEQLFPNRKTSHEPLPENDNDFRIIVDGKPAVLVECTEIVARDYLAAPETTTEFGIGQRDGSVQYADVEKIANALTKRLKHKLTKHYAKPKDTEFWLLIWSVTGLPVFGHYWQGGELKSSESVTRCRQFLAVNGAGPFDRVLFFDLLTNPTTVWPP